MTTRIWLCDLTYTQQTIGSDVMPAGVGGLATYAENVLANKPAFRIFKFPERLAEALETAEHPHIIGFSNYVWNRDLGAEFARVIKKHLPHVVTVMGGPNYPNDISEQEAFVRAHPMIDFFVIQEGERAFATLITALEESDFDPARVPDDLPSIHRINGEGTFCTSPLVDRILNLSEIPSPYLDGKMDEYFDGVMLPILQVNRGCPFRCTFCVEGMAYYSRVAKGNNEKIKAELEYICSRMAQLRDQNKGRSDLHISDSNFAMYKEDIEICEKIAEMQAKYDYPEYINVATGKNHKKRVLEAAKLINGALRLTGSVQTLDKQVLKNIDRANISEEELMDIALEASEIGANSYSEVILALPGDTREAHLTTIRKIVEADFNNLHLYQLMLLPGTDLATESSVETWKMRTKYRVLPRCFGYFDVFGEQINAGEIERIVVANDSLSFQDYLDCRHMHLVVNLFYNDGLFKEVLRLLTLLGVPKFDWLEEIWRHRGTTRFDALVEEFLEDTRTELWDSDADLRDFVRHRDTIKRYIAGELGANLIFKYRSRGLIECVADLAEVARETLVYLLKRSGMDQEVVTLGTELIEYARLRMTDLFENSDRVQRAVFTFDVDQLAQAVRLAPVASYKLPEPREYRFVLGEDAKHTIENFKAVYGETIVGIGRILTKVYFRRLLRSVEEEGGRSSHLSRRDEIMGEGQLSGLNEFV